VPAWDPGEERLGCWRPPGEKRPLMYPWRSGWDRRSVSCCMPEGKAAFARICAIRENIDSDPCVSLGKRAEVIPELIVFAITSL